VLASGSPRRRSLLAQLGLDFDVRPMDLDESVLPGEAPAAYVRRLAEAKARAACRPGELVLAADTTVVLDGAILGKPLDCGEAHAMLRALAGRRHEVYSGVALARERRGELECVSEVERTEVEMEMDPEELAWYAASGEGLDKAGAYAIQGVGGLFVTASYGSCSNVVGLPLATLRRLFRSFGENLLDRLPRGSGGAAAEG
jgi:septum formation protein